MLKSTFLAVALASATAFTAVSPAAAAIPVRVAPANIAAAIETPVQAAHWRHPQRRWYLAPVDVRRMLQRRGYHRIRFIDRRPPVYRVRAVTRRGHRVTLVVSSRTGEVIHRWRARY